jgi:enamine deaminase RidA (YjgF/YER057c/UK114 family)
MTVDPQTTDLARLAALGLVLPPAPRPNATYRPTSLAGTTLYVSGQLPFTESGDVLHRGKLGAECSLDEGVESARLCALNVLAQAAEALGDLGAIERVLRLTVLVASAPGFTEQHLVANGASDLVVEVLGTRGEHARTAFGAAALPFDAPVEVEAIFMVRSGPR